MEQGGVAETERMLSFTGRNTELIGGKGKSLKGFSKPNFEPLPSVIPTLLSATCLALVVTWSGLATIGV